MTDTLYGALARVQANLPRVGRTSQAQYGTYADLAEVTRVILPLLAAEGLAWTCIPTVVDGRFVLSFDLTHAESGDSVGGVFPLPEGNSQQIGSAITYARRYCLLAVTGAAPDDEDDDGQSASEAIIDRVRRTRETGSPPAEPSARRQAPGDAARAGRPADGGDPAGSLAPEEWPGSMDGRQRARMMAAFNALGVEDRNERMAQTVEMIGRPLESSNDLSYVEANDVLRVLEARVSALRKAGMA